jgi:hypothetical protein
MIATPLNPLVRQCLTIWNSLTKKVQATNNQDRPLINSKVELSIIGINAPVSEFNQALVVVFNAKI